MQSGLQLNDQLFLNDLERQLYAALEDQDADRLVNGLKRSTKNISPQLLHEIQFWSAEHGHVNILEALLADGVSFELQERRGNTLMHIAARCGHESILALLLREKPHLIRVRNQRCVTVFLFVNT